MVILASFIGVDKHIDSRIRDLTGARRDATALWALFSDTIPDMKSRLLVDGEATVDKVRLAFDETLGGAGPEDIVIISFSGHGTHDHRLVAYDTKPEVLSETTIAMDDLAARFKESRAKIILCILDCCFSGSAPARVFEDSPVSRDPGIPLEMLAGNGRILIAASSISQLAFEYPGKGNGLLTKAIIDVLQTGEGLVSLTAAIDQVISIVQSEAARMGVVQTPVLFGQVQGGLTFPVLRPGPNFFAAFPETRGIRVSGEIEQLGGFGLPKEILIEWANRFKGGLNDLQLQAVNDHRILDGESLLVVAPTSSGKTFIGEMAATRAIVEGRKAIFLLPYRALVNEKYDQFASLYGEDLGMRVIRCTGDYQDQTGALIRGKYDLALLTYEMFFNLAVSNPTILNQIGLVVLDEAQFITDPMRGITVELLLTYLIASREKGIEPQIIALSAVIGDINNFDAWLGSAKLVTDKRPILLIEGVLDRSGTFQFLDASGKVQTTQFLPAGAIRMRKEKPSAQDVIVPLVRMLVQKGEKVIVFRNQRGTAQGCAKYLADELGLPPTDETISSLPNHDLSATSADLRSCLMGGTAFHNTNLTREEKAVVEQAFREPESKVRVLGATTTVAAGINTPAETVILAEQEFMGDDGRPFTVAEYKNMAGRAGRLGFSGEGRSIILAETGHKRQTLFQRFVMGQLEPLHSSFDPEHLETWLVRLMAQINRVIRKEVIRLLSNTYGGYLETHRHPEWRKGMEQRLEQLLVRMMSLGLVEQEGEYVQLTLLGRACGRSALSFESAMRLVDLLRNVPSKPLSGEGLIALLQVLPESDGGYTPMMKKGQSESVRPREATERFGSDIIRALQRHAREDFDYYARCKRAAILWDWITGTPLEVIEKRYSPNPYQGRIGHGDVRKFADATRFHLRSAHQIVSVMFVGEGPTVDSIETLLRQLEVGIPADALDLLSLPASLSRGECLAFCQVGVKKVEAMWALPANSIKEILGPIRSAQLEKHRPISPK